VHGSLSDARTLAHMKALVEAAAAPESTSRAEAVLAARVALIDCLVQDGWVPPASTVRGRTSDLDVLACELGAWSRATEATIDLTRVRPREPEREHSTRWLRGRSPPAARRSASTLPAGSGSQASGPQRSPAARPARSGSPSGGGGSRSASTRR